MSLIIVNYEVIAYGEFRPFHGWPPSSRKHNLVKQYGVFANDKAYQFKHLIVDYILLAIAYL